MGRQSTIIRLPADARDALDRWLDDPAVTQTEATASVNALLAKSHPGHPPVSRRAVNRYHLYGRDLILRHTTPHKIAMRSGTTTPGAARAAGKKLGREIARFLPVEVRMHYVAALAAELSRTSPIGESRERRK
ncbi:MAG: DUF3486 family protein [Bryobacterales bacterium]|nr:DUF3486 family protein [Bryobacterales bacterium]